MADTVKVNGVTLTRSQVEEALKELNQPKFSPGDLLKRVKGQDSGQRYLVVGGDVDRAYAQAWPYLCSVDNMKHQVNTVRLSDGTAVTMNHSDVIRIGRLTDCLGGI